MTVDEPFKVFISWSGDRAKAVGTVIHEWLPTMFDAVKPWMSDVDIAAGSRGLNDIERALAGTSFGLVITTRANEHAPWLNFEAGALSKAVGNSPALVAPLLVDFEHDSDMTGPLQQFQCNLMNREGVRRFVASIASQVGVNKSAWEPRFSALWPDLESRLNRASALDEEALSTRTSARPPEDMLAEILSHVRSLLRTADHASLPRRTRTIVDDFDAFIASIDLDVRTRVTSYSGDTIDSAAITLRAPADPSVIAAVKDAVRERFGVELEVSDAAPWEDTSD